MPLVIDIVFSGLCKQSRNTTIYISKENEKNECFVI